jgi:hypothetical protein
MPDPTCPICSRPIPDMAYLCSTEATKLRTELERVALVAGEAMTTIAKQARIGNGGRRTDPEVPLPYNPGAAYDHDAAINTLQTVVRDIHETSGRPLPMVEPGQHPTAAMALWLIDQLEWLRHREDAEQTFDELSDACRVLVRVVDRPAERIIVGQCGCTEYLYAVRGAAKVTCVACNTTYAVEETRDMLRAQLDQSLFTAAEIATLATYLGLEKPRDTVRKLINKWSERGLVISHGDLRGDPAYLFGDVMARLLAG